LQNLPVLGLGVLACLLAVAGEWAISLELGARESGESSQRAEHIGRLEDAIKQLIAVQKAAADKASATTLSLDTMADEQRTGRDQLDAVLRELLEASKHNTEGMNSAKRAVETGVGELVRAQATQANEFRAATETYQQMVREELGKLGLAMQTTLEQSKLADEQLDRRFGRLEQRLSELAAHIGALADREATEAELRQRLAGDFNAAARETQQQVQALANAARQLPEEVKAAMRPIRDQLDQELGEYRAVLAEHRRGSDDANRELEQLWSRLIAQVSR
jgi:uncharacterized phage infection (PIP) family protein YhgE